MPKIRIISKNASNKSCWALNWVQKCQGAYVYLSQEGSKVFQELPFLKYYNVSKWESRFTLELNAAKNKHYIQKCFKLKLWSLKLATKKSGANMLISMRSGAKGSKDCPLKYYNVQKWESRFTFGLDAGKNMYVLYQKNASTKSC